MSEIKIIGIAGANGAGKDTVGEILADEYNYMFVSGSNILRAELRKQNLAITRENLRTLSSNWRRDSGLGVLVDRAVAEFENSKSDCLGVAIASIRNPGEADRIHELGGQLIWVDADSKLRYRRVQSANRGRDSEDAKTYDEFLAEEAAEMHRPEDGDEASLASASVKAKADIFINNDGNLASLAQQVNSFAK